MSPELEKQLINKYPDFFKYLKKYDGPIMPIMFGFEHDDGWYFLVNNLMSVIQQYINEHNNKKIIKNKFLRFIFNRNNIIYKHFNNSKYVRKFITYICYNLKNKIKPTEINVNPLTVNLLQVKEKSGGLCFYIYGGDNYIHDIINYTELLSYSVCEKCGSTKNVLQTEGWIYTLCKDCMDNKI